MKRQNIDQLFRGKLDRMEVMPSSQAWSQIERKIRSPKHLLVYWMAASLALLFISWLVWPEQIIQKTHPTTLEIDYPDPPEPFAHVAKGWKGDKRKTKRVNKVKTRQPSQTQFAVNDQPELTREEEKTDISNPSRQPIATIIKEMRKPITEAITEHKIETPQVHFKVVRITYIATPLDAQSQKKSKNDATGALRDATGALRKIIAFAANMSPGKLLANVKTAKDQLLNGGLKRKKEVPGIYDGILYNQNIKNDHYENTIQNESISSVGHYLFHGGISTACCHFSQLWIRRPKGYCEDRIEDWPDSHYHTKSQRFNFLAKL